MTPCMPHQELERELKAWEAQEAGAAAEAASEEQEAQRVRIEEFVAQQEGLSQSDISARSGKSVATASTMGRSLLSADTGEHAADTSFWVPQLTPQARTTLKKPDTTVRCPITAKPLRLKQLTPVKFTRLDESKDLRGQLTLTKTLTLTLTLTLTPTLTLTLTLALTLTRCGCGAPACRGSRR